MDRREFKEDGSQHEKNRLVRCVALDFELLKCKNVYNRDQSNKGNVPNRWVGCKSQIVVDLEDAKAAEYLKKM
jgi:hypothetical protein